MKVKEIWEKYGSLADGQLSGVTLRIKGHLISGRSTRLFVDLRDSEGDDIVVYCHVDHMSQSDMWRISAVLNKDTEVIVYGEIFKNMAGMLIIRAFSVFVALEFERDKG